MKLFQYVVNIVRMVLRELGGWNNIIPGFLQVLYNVSNRIWLIINLLFSQVNMPFTELNVTSNDELTNDLMDSIGAKKIDEVFHNIGYLIDNMGITSMDEPELFITSIAGGDLGAALTFLSKPTAEQIKTIYDSSKQDIVQLAEYKRQNDRMLALMSDSVIKPYLQDESKTENTVLLVMLLRNPEQYLSMIDVFGNEITYTMLAKLLICTLKCVSTIIRTLIREFEDNDGLGMYHVMNVAEKECSMQGISAAECHFDIDALNKKNDQKLFTKYSDLMQTTSDTITEIFCIMSMKIIISVLVKKRSTERLKEMITLMRIRHVRTIGEYIPPFGEFFSKLHNALVDTTIIDVITDCNKYEVIHMAAINNSVTADVFDKMTIKHLIFNDE